MIPLEVFEFTTDITPFVALAGITYWFSVVADANQFDPFFAWRPGTGGDDQTVQLFLAPGEVVSGGAFRSSDRAFALADSAIALPVPGTPALLIAALVGVAASRRWVQAKTAR
jgi:hypothetical protein